MKVWTRVAYAGVLCLQACQGAAGRADANPPKSASPENAATVGEIREAVAERLKLGDEKGAAKLSERACRKGDLDSCTQASLLYDEGPNRLAVNSFACKSLGHKPSCAEASAQFGRGGVPEDRVRRTEFSILGGNVDLAEQLIALEFDHAAPTTSGRTTAERLEHVQAIVKTADRFAVVLESTTREGDVARGALEAVVRKECARRYVELKEIYQDDPRFLDSLETPKTALCALP